jgi:transposase
MWKDEIVEEVRKERNEYAAKFDYDLNAIYKDIKEQEKQSLRKVVSLPSKKPELVPVEKAY